MKKMIKVTSLLIVFVLIVLLASCDNNTVEKEENTIPPIKVGKNVLENFDDYKSLYRLDMAITTFGKAILNHDKTYLTEGEASAKIWTVDHDIYKDQYKSSYIKVQTINKFEQDFRDFSKVNSVTLDVYNAGEHPLTISMYLIEVKTLEYFSDKANYTVEPGSWQTLEFVVDKTMVSSVMEITNITHIGVDMAGINGLLYMDNMVIDISADSYKRYTKLSYDGQTPIDVYKELKLNQSDVTSFDFVRPNGDVVSVSNLSEFRPEYAGTLNLKTKDSKGNSIIHSVAVGVKRAYGVFENFDNAFTTEFTLASSTIIAEKSIVDVDDKNGLYFNFIGGASTSIMIDFDTNKFTEYNDFDYVSIRFKANYKNDINGTISFRFNDKWIAPINQDGATISVSTISIDGEWMTLKYHKSQFQTLFGTELNRVFLWITKYQADDLEFTIDSIYGEYEDIVKEAQTDSINLYEYLGYTSQQASNFEFIAENGTKTAIEDPTKFIVTSNGKVSFSVTRLNLKASTKTINVVLFVPSKTYNVIDDFEAANLAAYTHTSGVVDAQKSLTSDSYNGQNALKWDLTIKENGNGNAIFFDFINGEKYQYIKAFDSLTLRYKATYANGETYTIPVTMSITGLTGGAIPGSSSHNFTLLADGNWNSLILNKEQLNKIFVTNDFGMLRMLSTVALTTRGEGLEVLFDHFELGYDALEAVEQTSINLSEKFNLGSEDTVNVTYQIGENTPEEIMNLSAFEPTQSGTLVVKIKKPNYVETVFSLEVTVVHQKEYLVIDGFETTDLELYKFVSGSVFADKSYTSDSYGGNQALQWDLTVNTTGNAVFLDFLNSGKYEHILTFDTLTIYYKASYKDGRSHTINATIATTNDAGVAITGTTSQTVSFLADGNWNALTLSKKQFENIFKTNNFYMLRFLADIKLSERGSELEFIFDHFKGGFEPIEVFESESINLIHKFGIDANDILTADYKVGDTQTLITDLNHFVPTQDGVVVVKITKYGYKVESFEVPVTIVENHTYARLDNFSQENIEKYQLRTTPSDVVAQKSLIDSETVTALKLNLDARNTSGETALTIGFDDWKFYGHYQQFDYIDIRLSASFSDDTKANINLKINNTWAVLKQQGASDRNIYTDGNLKTLRLTKDQFSAAGLNDKFELVFTRFAGHYSLGLEIVIDGIFFGYDDLTVQGEKSIDIASHLGLLTTEVVSAKFNGENVENPSAFLINQSGTLEVVINKLGFDETTLTLNIVYSNLKYRSTFDDFNAAFISNYVLSASPADSAPSLSIHDFDGNASLAVHINTSTKQTDIGVKFALWDKQTYADFDYIEFKVKAQFVDGTVANIGLRMNATWKKFSDLNGTEYRDNIPANGSWLTLRLNKDLYSELLLDSKFEFTISRWAGNASKELNVYFDDILFGYNDQTVSSGAAINILELTNLLDTEIVSAQFITENDAFEVDDLTAVTITESGYIEMVVNKEGFFEETIKIYINLEE